MGWQLEQVPALDGFTVEWLAPDRMYLSRHHRIYRADGPGAAIRGQLELVGEIAASGWKSTMARVRLAQRLMRFLTYNVLPLADDVLFVTFGKQIGTIAGGGYRPVAGLQRPCRILRGGCALDADGSVYWGEYIRNQNRGPIHIYRFHPGEPSARVVYTFEAGEIRHVHGIYRNPHSGALWCLTGDRAGECRVLRTTDGFRTVETAGSGDETWRAVSALLRRESIYYASDAEFRSNSIYRFDRETGKRTEICEIDGPVYYSHAVGEDLFFATAAELCPSQQRPVSSLWYVDVEDHAHQLAHWTKDLIHLKRVAMAFLPGTLQFPAGPGLSESRQTFFSGIALRGLDDHTVRLHHVEDTT